jgi:cell wall-associated NlpC family hydrolase
MKLFTPELQSKYLRIPFKDKGRDFKGCDCGGLVWLVYKNELGIELPDWRDYYSCTQLSHSSEMFNAVSTMLGANGVEVPLEKAQPFDVISIRIGGADVHVGLVVNSRFFLHIMEGRTTVAQERLDSHQWAKRITGCFRHERMFEK